MWNSSVASRQPAGLVFALAALVLAPAVHAAAYPDKPVRLIVAAAPGGSADAIARTFQPGMAEALGQTLVIDNRAGASGIIGIELAAKAAADGYTVLLNTSTHTTMPALSARLPFDLERDFAAVTLLVSQPNILVVHPSLPVKTVKDLVAYAKAKPDALNFASGGTGTSPHLAGEMLKLQAGIAMTHVPYKGSGPAIGDLLGGHVQVMFAGPFAVAQHARAGRLRALAIAAIKRSSALPAVPTLAEAGFPGMENGTWYGLVAPARTPKAVIARLHEAARKAAATPASKKQLEAMSVDVGLNQPDEFEKFISQEIRRWGKVVRDARIKAD
ncbi:MAG: tripartite tricarboxylate transporter substrate binding protein [Betaproteobacteria bacterium]|nr:tripartite tricarboxylate transporter substrate binding protein [Betaproteobacteria bacterium]